MLYQKSEAMNIPRIYTATLISRHDSARDTPVFVFSKPTDLVFTAGQYLTLRILEPAFTDAKGMSRALSIASAPNDQDIVLVWRRSSSAFKRSADALPIGATVQMIGPMGQMSMPKDQTTPVVFLIGGIGITPVRSMLRAETDSARPVWLFYGNNTREDAPFFDEMTTLCDVPGRTIIHTLMEAPESWSGQRGYITTTMICDHVPRPTEAQYYIVGTSGFIAAMKDIVTEMGIGETQIVTDNFGTYTPPLS